MQPPPRRPTEMLFGLRQIALAGLQGAVVLAAVLGLYVWAAQQYPAAEARGAAFAALVGANLFLAFSDSASSGVALFDRHRVTFWLIVLAALAVVGAILFLPIFETIFRVAAPGPLLLLAAVLTAVISGGWFGLGRALYRRLGVAPARA